MSLSGDDRAVVVQVGAVVLLGFIVLAMTIYQVHVVPQQNEKVEYDHSLGVQDQLIEVRSAILTTGAGGGTRSAPVALGTSYPSRTVFVNPPPPYGEIRTVGTTNDSVAIAIENARATNEETAHRWNGTNHSFPTGWLVYEPFYNLYDEGPTTTYDHSVVVNRFEDATLAETDQGLVDNRTITLVAIDGDLQESGVEGVSIDARPLSASTETTRIANDGGPITIRVPTTVPNETWTELLAPELAPRGNVSTFELDISGSGPDTLVVELQPGTYTLQLAKIGVGPDARAPPESDHYLTTAEATDRSVRTSGTIDLTVQVRDRFNNPVTGELVTVSAPGNVTPTSARSDADGEVTVTFEPPDSTGTRSVVASIDDNGTAAKRVEFDVAVTPGSGAGGAYAIEWQRPTASEPGALLDCTEERCTWDVGKDGDGRLDLAAALDENLDGIATEFGVNDSSLGFVQPGDGETNASGTASTDLVALGNGTVDVVASTGGDSDRIAIHLTNVTNASRGQNHRPAATFTTSPSPPNAGEIVHFDASNTTDPDGAIVSYEWTFGDGTTAVGPEPAHVYATSGTYDVSLTVTDDLGATATASETIEVNTPPTAHFTYSPSNPGTADTITFDGSASADPDGTIVSYEWDFGNSATGTGPTATHSYADDGSYAVELTVTDDAGATDTFVEVVDVGNQRPTANFTYSPSTPRVGDVVQFDSSVARDYDGSITTYQWSFGDGTTAIGANPAHTYDEVGDYTVSLTVFDDDGVVDTIVRILHVSTQTPEPEFTYSPSNPATGQAIDFDASGSSDPDGSIVDYRWDFDDGTTASGEEHAHVYDSDGTYDVALTVTDDRGVTERITKTVAVTNTLPVADFTYTPAEPDRDETVTFDASASSDPDGTIESYEWDLDGDGAFEATGVTTTRSYSRPGIYDVTVRVIDEDGGVGTRNETLNVGGLRYENDAVAKDGPDDDLVSGGVEFTLTNAHTQAVTLTGLDIEAVSPDVSRIGDWIDDPVYRPTTTEVYVEADQRDGHVDTWGSHSLPYEIDFDANDYVSSGENPIVSSGESTSVSLYEFKEGWRDPLNMHGERIAVTVSYELADGTPEETSFTITIEDEAPVANFSHSPTGPQTGEAVTFDASNSSDADGSIVGYDWAFGDGTEATGETVTHSYDEYRNYTVTLTVTDDDGRTNTANGTVVLQNDRPIANLSMDSPAPDPGETVTFDGSGSTDPDGTIESYEWDMGDGTTATGPTRTHSYVVESDYTVTLTVTDDGNRTDTATRTFDVAPNQAPTANASASPDVADLGQSITFAANGSTDLDGSIETYHWDFGDGSTATGERVTHNYGSEATYTVALTVTDDDGATDTTTIDVQALANRPPTADFASPTDPGVYDPATFDGGASSDSDGTIVSFEWDFGDGGTDTGETGSHTWTEAGTYTVTLTVTDDDGATDVDSAIVDVVPNDPPTADFDPPYRPDQYESARFDASLASDSDGGIESYVWDFGDGSTGTGEVVYHAFDSGGPVTVTLTVTDDDGATGSVSKTVDVDPNEAPTARIDYYPDDPDPGETVNLYGQSSGDADGEVVDWEWSLGDGSTTTGETSTHTYSGSGTYTLSLTVTDDDGATDTATTTVTVNDPPVADVVASPTQAEPGEFVSFDAGGSSDSDGAIDRYEWDFGDGSTAPTPGPDAGHTYDSSGTYTVTVTVVDDDGATDTASTTVTVNDPPVAAVTASPSVADVGEFVSFDAGGSYDSDGTIDRYEWAFGDGSTAPTPGPDAGHRYYSAGYFTVTLTVIDDDGATDTASTTVRVESNEAPTADISAYPSDPGVGERVDFYGTGSSDPDGYITSYQWNFGDGGYASGDYTYHTYSSGGYYTVSLTVTDDDGATDTDYYSIYVEPNQDPVADFEAYPTQPTIGQTVDLDGSDSYDPDGGIVYWEWDFGDGISGGSSNLYETWHRYYDTGYFQITLTVTDEDGATGSDSVWVHVTWNRVGSPAALPDQPIVDDGFSEAGVPERMKPPESTAFGARGLDPPPTPPADGRATLLGPERDPAVSPATSIEPDHSSGDGGLGVTDRIAPSLDVATVVRGPVPDPSLSGFSTPRASRSERRSMADDLDPPPPHRQRLPR